VQILYVENDPAEAVLTRQCLYNLDPHFQLDMVATLAEATAHLADRQRAPYDVVLIGVRIAQMYGLSLLTSIREQALSLAVVVMCGAGGEESAVAMLESINIPEVSGTTHWNGGVARSAITMGPCSFVVKHPGSLEQLASQLAEVFCHLDCRRRCQALSDTEIKLRLLLEATHAVPWQATAEHGNIRDVGPQAVELLGYPLEAWSEPDFWVSHVHPDDRAQAMASCLRGSAACPYVVCEYRMRHASGHVIWIQDIVDRDGVPSKPGLLRGFMIDITARKQAEEGERAALGLLQSTIDALSAHIAILDEHATIITVNEPWRSFALTAGVDLPNHGVGVNFLRLCEAATGPLADIGLQVAPGIRAVMHGEREEFRLTYASDVRAEKAWFQLRVTRFGLEGRYHLVLSHENITEIKQAEEGIRDLAAQLLNAQEEERRWVARELHDDVTQRLAGLAIGVGALVRHVPPQMAPLRQKLNAVQEQIVALSSGVHRLSRQLHSSILDDFGVVDAIAVECERCAEHGGIPVTFRPQDVPVTFPSPVALCLYRVTQEGLHNLAKHAKATEAEVSLVGEHNGVKLTIRDNGIGFDPSQAKGGLGLASMRERVRLINGRVAIMTHPGCGTVIEVWAPVAGREG
jgi:two-component system NarL family sensor kinase